MKVTYSKPNLDKLLSQLQGGFDARYQRAIDIRRGPQGEKGEKGDKGDKGDPGYTPVKGIDYFDGKDGKRGLQGKKGDKGDKPILGVDYTVKNGQDGKDAVVDEKKIIELLIEVIKKDKPLDISHIRNAPWAGGKKIDQRWHGGSPTLVAGSNTTITKNDDGTVTIASTGGVTTTSETFETTGGVQVVTLSDIPISILQVIINGQPQNPADYSNVGSNVTINLPDVPAGLWGQVIYTK